MKIPNLDTWNLWQMYANHRQLALFYHIATGKLYKPSHSKILVADIFSRRTEVKSNLAHCRAALQWLFEAQDIAKVGGIANEYNFSWGWSLPYLETNGYIIPTMLNLAKQFPADFDIGEIEARTTRIADWLVSIQNKDGSYDSGMYYDAKVHGHISLVQKIGTMRNKPSAMETGQILWGLTAIYEYTGRQSYLDAAIKASDWLVGQQLLDGTWIEYIGVPCSWSVVTARHLALLAKITGKKSYEETAIKNCDWCLSKQNEVGWFDACAHTVGKLPWTHGIGYVLQGLLEVGICLNKTEYISAVLKTSEALLNIYSDKGFLPARYNSDWSSKDKFSCLVGNAQISVVWCILYQVTKDIRYLNGALKINRELKSSQVLDSSEVGIRGGIKGSQPIWGLYRTFGYPCWAVKFFIDALLLEEKVAKSGT